MCIRDSFCTWQTARQPVPTQNSKCRRNSRISLAFGVLSRDSVDARTARAEMLRRIFNWRLRDQKRGARAVPPLSGAPGITRGFRDNNVDQALKVLKKKMQRE